MSKLFDDLKFLDTIEELSKSTNLHNGAIEDFTKEILERSALVLGCERCNSWIFSADGRQLDSLLAYSSKTHVFSTDQPLTRKAFPNYFKFLRKNELIVSVNAQEEPMNSDLLQSYLIPNNIMSMIDVPIRSEGKMIGVICFEHVSVRHNWTDEECKFTQSVAQLLSLVLETKEKRIYREKLEEIITQKEILISEINHRVKNNMAVILSLLNLQRAKTTDDYHSQLFTEIKDKVYSMSAVQEQLHTSDNVDSINLGEYIKKLVQNHSTSYEQEQIVCVELSLDTVQLDVSRAIPCGLIANEILTNCYKYAFDEFNLFPKLEVVLLSYNDRIELIIKDNGKGFDNNTIKRGMGLELIGGLAEQIDGEIIIDSDEGAEVKLIFSVVE